MGADSVVVVVAVTEVVGIGRAAVGFVITVFEESTILGVASPDAGVKVPELGLLVEDE